MKLKTVFILTVLLSGLFVSSCSSSRMTRQQRQAMRMEKQMKKENKKQVDAYLKHHYAIQPESTQKMMKNSKKRAKQMNKKHRESFVQRVFGRKSSCSGN